MTWIKSDIDLDIPYAVLTATNRDLTNAMGGMANMQGILKNGGPDTVEAVLKDLIQDIRPSLSGGVLCSIKYNVARRLWEFGYIHPILPRLSGHTAHMIPLLGQHSDRVWADPTNPKAVDVAGNVIDSNAQQYDLPVSDYSSSGTGT